MNGLESASREKDKCRSRTDYTPKIYSSVTAAPAAGRISATIAQNLYVKDSHFFGLQIANNTVVGQVLHGNGLY